MFVLAGNDDDPVEGLDDVNMPSVEPTQGFRGDDVLRFPLATLPPAMYTTRSITGRSGFMPWAANRTATCCTLATRATRLTTSCSLLMSRLASGSSSRRRLGPTDEGVRDHDALLLSTREIAHPGDREAVASTASSIASIRALRFAVGRRHPETMAVDPEPDEVPSPDGHVGIEPDLLRDVADERVPARPGFAGHPDCSRRRCDQTHDDPEQRRLARSVRADQPDELTGIASEADVTEDLPTDSETLTSLDRQNLGASCSRLCPPWLQAGRRDMVVPQPSSTQ